jgi:hypothetical protein
MQAGRTKRSWSGYEEALCPSTRVVYEVGGRIVGGYASTKLRRVVVVKSYRFTFGLSFCLLELQLAFVLIMVNQLAKVLIGKHSRHGGRDGPEQVGANSGIERTPAFFPENGLTCAQDSAVTGAIGHAV